jgi:hypothetical protein
MFEDLSPSPGPDGVPNDPATPLILDFLEWLAPRPRPYDEVMEAWRTSCPRLTVWEDAVDAGLVVRTAIGRGQAVVEVTALGQRRLDASGRSIQP